MNGRMNEWQRDFSKQQYSIREALVLESFAVHFTVKQTDIP